MKFLITKSLKILLIYGISSLVTINSAVAQKNYFFSENWDSENFTTNDWTFYPEQGRWVINTVDGNSKPSVEFVNSPALYNYSYALISPFISKPDSVSEIQLQFDFYSFDIFGIQNLSIEVGDGTIWTQLAEISNSPNNWTHFCYYFEPSSLFKIRFVVSGDSLYSYNKLNIDNINVGNIEESTLSGTIFSSYTGVPIPYATVQAGDYSCTANENGEYSLCMLGGTYNVNYSADRHYNYIKSDYIFNANSIINVTLINTTCNSPQFPDFDITGTSSTNAGIQLTWDAPATANQWINFDDGTNNDAIGIASNEHYSVAIRFEPQQLFPFAGDSLTQVRFFPRGTHTLYTIKVWEGSNAASLVASVPLSEPTMNEWNTIDLPAPVIIDTTQELWIGYLCDNTEGDFPAGCDNGPAFTGYGDMFSMNEMDWISISSLGLNYNWNIQGYIKSADQNNNSALGYNLYREGVILNTSPIQTTFYLDSVPYNDTTTYCITTICNSDESECAYIQLFLTSVSEIQNETLKIAPNPASGYVTITLPEGFTTLQLMNMLGQTVIQRNLTQTEVTLDISGLKPGTYLIRTSNNQEIIQQKLVISH